MRREVALFVTAVQLLTRVPTPQLEGFQPNWVARSARYYPLVGALVGGAAALALLGAAQLWTGALPALLAVGAGILLTGAFHEDGLADAADGLGGGLTRERRLQIMRDSRIGSYGALALGLVLGAKVLALAEMPTGTAAAALVACHAGGRAAAVVLMRLHPYAGERERAKLGPTAEGVTSGDTAVAVAVAILAAVSVLWHAPEAAAVGVTAGAAAAAAMGWWARRAIGGWVGDTLGAAEQAFEAAFLLAVAAAVA